MNFSSIPYRSLVRGLLLTVIILITLLLFVSYISMPSETVATGRLLQQINRIHTFSRKNGSLLSTFDTANSESVNPSRSDTNSLSKPLLRISQYDTKGSLVPNLPPSIVHYFLCGAGWFEFKQYLSVVSVLRSVQPDRIILHCQQHPSIDRVYYNQWLDDLKHDYPWLHVERMNDELFRYCNTTDREAKIGIIMDILTVDGGMYVGENTWLVNFPPTRRLIDIDFSLEPDSMDGYIILRRNVLSGNANLRQILTLNSTGSRRSSCSKVHHIYQDENLLQETPCVILRPEDVFYPMDIWERSDSFGRLTRRLFYGTEEIRKPVPTYDELVPNIAHMIWIGGGEMDFVFYLSVLSLLFVAKVETVYVHGDIEPPGDNWREIQTLPQTKDRVKFITRIPPSQIYQGAIEPWYRALMSDLIRVDLMIKYGGIYTDTDAIWVKPLSYEDRGYDAVASFDWVDWSWPFPDSVNFGISYGKRTAPFWPIFRDSMRTLHNDVHGFTGVMMPYKLLEKYPELLRIDRHLQVICYHSQCHPTWIDDYHNMTKNHINMGSIPNWRQDVNAFHWTHPNPPALANRSVLLKSTGLFTDIGKFVLREAGLL